MKRDAITRERHASIVADAHRNKKQRQISLRVESIGRSKSIGQRQLRNGSEKAEGVSARIDVVIRDIWSPRRGSIGSYGLIQQEK